MQATVFQSAPYLSTYRRFFGGGKTFYRVTVGEAENLIGEAYLMSRGGVLRFWGDDIHDIGALRGDDESAAHALWNELEKAQNRFDGIVLSQMRADSPLVHFAQNAGWEVSAGESCPVLALPPSFDEYSKSLGKNMREQIRRYPKRLAKKYECEYSVAQTREEIERALDELFVLHGKRWRARGQTGVLVLPQRRRFHRALCHELAKKNMLRLFTLRCDGRAAASLLCYSHEGVVSYFIGGFEPELMPLSVGTCLFAFAIRTSIEEGCREFDFLKGREDYKYRLGARDREYSNIAWFAPHWRGAWLRRQYETKSYLMHRLHQKFSAAEQNTASKLK